MAIFGAIAGATTPPLRHARPTTWRASGGVRHASRTFSEQVTPQRHMLHMVAEAMLGADRVAKITGNGPGTANSAAHMSQRAALRPKSSLAVAHNGEKPSTRGVYRGARKVKGGGIAYTRTCFSLLPTSGTSRARCATRAAPLRKSRRLAEFATKRSGLNKKKRSERRFCARTGDFVETWSGR